MQRLCIILTKHRILGETGFEKPKTSKQLIAIKNRLINGVIGNNMIFRTFLIHLNRLNPISVKMKLKIILFLFSNFFFRPNNRFNSLKN